MGGQISVRIGQKRDQSLNIVPSLHRPEESDGLHPVQAGHLSLLAEGHRGEVGRLDVGGLVDAGGDPVGEEVEAAL